MCDYHVMVRLASNGSWVDDSHADGGQRLMCYRETAHYVVLCDRCGPGRAGGNGLVDAVARRPGRPRGGLGDDPDRAPVPNVRDRSR